MKFVHIADLHLDTPFKSLSCRENLGDIRRIDQRNALRKMIEYIKENNIPYLFICGDLYEQSSIRESTIKYINNLFSQIPDTKIYITPGNHDPLIKNSYYKIYEWEKNVTIFNENITKIEEPEFNLYGYGFNDFYMKQDKLNEIEIDNHDKLNIFTTHAGLDGGADEERVYNPITSAQLKTFGFDYIALGHIHKKNLEANDQIIVYPGSMCSLGFDELGEHGMVVGELNKDADGKVTRKIEFIALDSKQFAKQECDVSEFSSDIDLIEHINLSKFDDDKLYEIVLVGNRQFEINIYKLYKLINQANVIKLKNKTKLGVNLDELAKEVSLRGIFVKKMLEKLSNPDEDKEIIEKAIEVGLDSLSKGE